MTSAGRHRIGVVLDSLECTRCAFDVIEALRNDAGIELVLILEKAAGPATLASRGSVQSLQRAALAACRAAETRVVGAFNGALRHHLAPHRAERSAFSRIIEVSPGLSARGLRTYPLADLEIIRAAGLDVIVQAAGHDGAYDAEVCAAARNGMISIEAGENGGNSRMMPPAFWEVFHRRPSTAYAIVRRNGASDTAAILHQGAVATKRSYSENLLSIHRESAPMLTRSVSLLLAGRLAEGTAETAPCSTHAASGAFPGLLHTTRYAARSAARHARLAVERKLLRRNQRWGVAYAREHWQDAALAQGRRIDNPRHRFFADPFVVKRDGRHYVFAEDYDERRRLGAISCIVVEPDDSYRVVENILIEPFHLSFPLVLEHGGELYMMPETVATATVRLYRCAEFPHRWEFHKEVLTDVHAADSMPFERDGKWFLLTNINRAGTGDHGSQLHVLVADDLLSGAWRPLSPFPVVDDPLCGRNAGFLYGRDGALYRVRQRQGFDSYGAGFSIARVLKLDSEGYAEQTYRVVEATFFPGITGAHHMHGLDDFTVYDFATIERYGERRKPPAAGIVGAGRSVPR